MEEKIHVRDDGNVTDNADTTDKGYDDGLAARIDRLEQIERISALKYRYLRASDAKDPDAFRAAFVRGAADIDYGPAMGRYDNADDLTAVFRRIALAEVDGRPLVLDMHHGLHGDIAVTAPGRAEGRWTLSFRQADLAGKTLRTATIEYLDGYVVEDGEWRIVKSHARTLWSLVEPLTDRHRIEIGEDAPWRATPQ